MTLRRVGLSNSLSTQAKITNRRFTLSRVSLRRFPFPTAAAAAAVVNYVEDVFSTYLYTGVAGGLTITNNIDLSGKGGMVWTKGRNYVVPAAIFDTVRGANQVLRTSSTVGQGSPTDALTGFTSSGYTLGADASDWGVNYSPSYNYASWTFRKQTKFFDIVTYTGTGVNRTISHNLGSVPGFIIVKRYEAAGGWAVYHRGLTNASRAIYLNTTAAEVTDSTIWNSTAPTSTQFSVGDSGTVNSSSGTYVAYLFAHDAGGFGAAGTDNVISCGSFTTSPTGGATITLGYEPQWLLLKASGATGDWYIIDTMRGFAVSGTNNDQWLAAQSSASETGPSGLGGPTANGFVVTNLTGDMTYIYVAIRRGPMKTPTSGTSVFSPFISTQPLDSNNRPPDPGFVTDTLLFKPRTINILSSSITDRLRGNVISDTASTAAEYGNYFYWSSLQTGVRGGSSTYSSGATSFVWYFLRRAPGFFDVVCYTGNGVAGLTLTHNLQVVPEIMIVRSRTTATSWGVYSQPTGNGQYLILNQTNAVATASSYWNNTSPTSSSFTVGNVNIVNGNGVSHIAYLFASCPGVSKVGSYTGNGSSQTINCGFTAGARFILIKRTDIDGDWYVWDTARGIIAGDDPHLSLNTAVGEVTTDDSIDSDNTGFIVNQLTATNINVTSATYIFLAIA